MKNKTPEPELHRPLRTEKISPNGAEQTIVASERECAALAERFGLISIEKLEAKLRIVPERAGLNYAVRGDVSAEVTQRCVVTLEPLPAVVEQAVNVHFALPQFFEGAPAERDLEEDDIEPIEDGTIDLGELTAQHLGLGLDPYPRKPGLPPVEAQFGEPVASTNPFARLTVLKGNAGDKSKK